MDVRGGMRNVQKEEGVWFGEVLGLERYSVLSAGTQDSAGSCAGPSRKRLAAELSGVLARSGPALPITVHYGDD